MAGIATPAVIQQGNKLGREGQGARNKPPAYPFMDENDLSAPARRFRGVDVADGQ
jgi:hypothetical protein